MKHSLSKENLAIWDILIILQYQSSLTMGFTPQISYFWFGTRKVYGYEKNKTFSAMTA